MILNNQLVFFFLFCSNGEVLAVIEAKRTRRGARVGKEQLYNRSLKLKQDKISSLAILVSLYFTVGRGIIDAEKSRLEIQKDQLKRDISRFEAKRDTLIASIGIKIVSIIN